MIPLAMWTNPYKPMKVITVMIIQKREETEPAFKKYYSNLAEFMVNLVTTHVNQGSAVILEAGCGDGALTVPLLSLLDYSLYICYDLYAGVYGESLQEIKKKGLDITLVTGDVRTMSFHSESVDMIFSNELLCDLTRDDTQKTVNEFYRILKDNSTFVHGVLSPYPENKAQEMVIRADSYSADPLFPSEWFSPPADVLAGMLHQAGFSNIGVAYFEETLHFSGDRAVEQVQEWVTKPVFFEKYSEDLRKHGLEFPMEQVVYCQK